MKKRWLSIFMASLLLLGLLSGCDSSNPPAETAPNEPAGSEAPAEPADSAEPAQSNGGKDKVVIATENETTSVTTAEHNATAASYINSITHNGLFRQDENLDPVPDLVASYENISDTEWMMTLHEGITFHNGMPCTTEDVKATLEYVRQFSHVEQFTTAIADIEIIDDLTLKITTNGPSSILLYDLGHHGNFILPKPLIDEGHDFNEDPVGTGPYRMVTWNLGDNLEFEMHENYFDKELSPTIPNLEVRVIPEPSSRTIALENKEVDFIIETPTIDYDRLKENSDIVVFEKTGVTHNYIMFNNELPAFSNPLVRKALNAAIDRESIVAIATNGMATPVTTQAPIGFSGSTEENSIGYDPELAKQLLEESGVDPADIPFTVICSDERKRRAAEVIQSNLGELGIEVSIETMDLTNYLSVTTDGDYVAAIGNYTATDLVTYLKSVHSSKQIGGSNRSRCNDPAIDALIEKAEVTVDADERNAVLQECIALVNDYAPQVPIFQDKILRAHSKDLGGVVITGTGGMLVQALKWN